MIALYIIAVIIFLGYSAYSIFKNGISKSFSDTFYDLGKMGWLFQLVMVSLTFLLLPVILELSEGFIFQPVAFLTVVPIGFVGLTPLFKMKRTTESIVHVCSALLSAVCSLLFISSVVHLNSLILYSTVCITLLMLIGYALNNFNNIVWWLEYICFISLLTTLGILLFA